MFKFWYVFLLGRLGRFLIFLGFLGGFWSGFCLFCRVINISGLKEEWFRLFSFKMVIEFEEILRNGELFFFFNGFCVGDDGK